LMSDRKRRAGGKRSTQKKKRIMWEQIQEQAYDRIQWYATRFVLFSTVGVVIGFIALVYATLMVFIFGSQLQDINVFLGVFVGVGAIAASIVLLIWGFFLRRRAETRSLF